MEDLGGSLIVALDAMAFGASLAEVDLAEGRLVAIALGADLETAPAGAFTAAWHPDERALLETLPPRRARTWVGGRLALRRALGEGHDAQPILADDRGAPSLPAGVVGSIAHKDAVAVALASRDPDHRVGVDVEVAASLPSLRLTSKILGDDEAVELLRGSESARARALLLAFSAKEAIYKAIDPYLRRYVGFHEVRLRGEPVGYEVEPRLKTGETLRISARAFVAGDVILSVATARPCRGP